VTNVLITSFSIRQYRNPFLSAPASLAGNHMDSLTAISDVHRMGAKSEAPGPADPNVFEPSIVAFCCNWCAYAGADLAGVSRIQYPSNIRVVRVMCSGRVDPGMILRSFEMGADGVMVLGCHIGDCHYIAGNRKAEVKVRDCQKLLGLMGIDPRRLLLRWISAAEGALFASTAAEFTALIGELGPIGRE
jgi:F420-non-reducing hydrogenase iron-sulfur subunit